MRTYVKDAMTRQVFAVAPDTSLETVARLFATRHITGAPVVDSHDRAVGVITQTDLLDPDRPRSDEVGRSLYFRLGTAPRELDLADVALGQGIVADLMSPFVLSVRSDAPLEEAAHMMLLDNVHRLFVIDGERVVGVITTTDVLRALSRRRVPAR